MAGYSEEFKRIESTFKKAAAALRDAGIPFALGGSLAAWARGGPETRKDLDFMIREKDAERALSTLVQTGMRPERPPEGWLLKAWDGDVLVDLIYRAVDLAITDEVFERSEEMSVLSLNMRVLSLEDVISSKLLALNEHDLDFEPLLRIVRAVREQVEWHEVRTRTSSSPYARAFFGLLAELDLDVDGAHEATTQARSKIRVLPPTAG